jgi:hypothetical protein
MDSLIRVLLFKFNFESFAREHRISENIQVFFVNWCKIEILG